MHVKLATLATAALAASASAFTETESVYKHPMYEVENQICINKEAVMTCRDGYTPIYDETYRTNEILCLERTHSLVREMPRIMETGNNLRLLRSEATKRQLTVRSIKRCVKASTTNVLSNFDSIRTDDSKFEYSSKFDTKYRLSNPEAEREIHEKLIQLNKLIPTFVQSIQLTDSEYKSVFDLLKEVNKYEKMHYALHRFTKQMPALYVQTVRQVQQTLLGKSIDESLTNDEQDLKKEVKRLAERVYAHIMLKFDQQIQSARSMNVERLNDVKFEVVPVLESVWNEIRTQLSGRTLQSIEKHMIQREEQVQKQIEEQVQVDELQFQPIDKYEKKQIQMLLEKVFLASIHLTKDVQEGKLQEVRREKSLLNKLFDKEARYIQLIKMYKQKYNFDF